MPGDLLWRLRLKYEHSRGACGLCARQGIVGEDIKLIVPPENQFLATEGRGISYRLRCADLVRCRQRIGIK